VGIQYRPFQRVKGGGELRGGIVLVGEMKKAGHWFGSATHARRRAADSDARRGGTWPGQRCSGETEEEKGPGGPVLGRKAVVTWANVGVSKEKLRRAAMAIGLY
jgi:hypothetical protein